MSKLIVYLGVAIALAACSHKQTQVEQTVSAPTAAAGEKHVDASLNWIKNKKDTVDLELKVTNGTDAPIRVYTTEVAMEYGGQKLTPRAAGDLRVAPGVTSQVVLIYKFGKGKPKEGPANLTITPYGADDKALEPVKISFNVTKK